MIDSLSKFEKNCDVAPEADVNESELAEEVFIDKYTKVLNSKLGRKVRLERCNSILYSTLGMYSYTGPNTTIRNATVGKFNSMSWNVSIGGNNHDLNHVTTHSFLVYPKWEMGGNSNWMSANDECTVENDVWIGSGANILRGVHIGSGAVIGAGAVVTKNVDPYTIVVGNPAKVLRLRMDERFIERMLQLKWWDFPIDVIRENFELFHAELSDEIIDRLFEVKEKLH